MLGISSILKEPLGISYLEWQEIIFVANIIPVSFSMLEQQRIKRTRKKQGLLELKSSEINSEKRTLCFWKWMLQVKKFNSRLMFSRLDFWHCLFIDYLFFFCDTWPIICHDNQKQKPIFSLRVLWKTVTYLHTDMPLGFSSLTIREKSSQRFKMP